MATVYLHIGMPKTGTTSLQRFLRENEDILHRQNITYPNMSKALGFTDKDHRSAYFLNIGHYGDTKPDENLIKKGWAEISKLAKQYDKIILSDEGLWSISSSRPAFWPGIAEDIQNIGCELKVIVYLRRQDEIIQSYWNQRIKRNRLDKSFEEYISEKNYSFLPLDYYEALTHMSQYVHKENILVRIYEEEQFQGEDHTLLSDFMDTVGLVKDPEFNYEVQYPNFSIRGNFIEMRWRMNQIPEYKQSDDFICEPLVRASRFADPSRHSKVSLFKYEDAVAFLKQYEESNQKTAREFLNRENGILFYNKIEKQPLYEIDHEKLIWDMMLLNVEIFTDLRNQHKEEINQLKKEINSLKKDTNAMSKSIIFRVYRAFRRIFGKAKTK